MKLSPAFLAYKLSSAFSVLAPENLPLSGTLELPVLYQTGSAATAHRVFLCTEEQIGSLSSLPEESSSLFLLCTEELPEELPAPVSIAVKSSVSAVFSFLQELFWTYDSWQKELMQARLDGKSIQHLLNLSLPVFAHPLMVVGMDFSIIAAASEEPSFFPEKVFGSLDATRPLLLSLTESSEYASVRDLDGWFRFPDHVTGLGSLCVNITQHGQSAYRLLLLDTKKDLSDSEGFLLEFLAEMIHHAFLHNVMQKTSPAQSLHTVLLRALDDRMADYIAVSQALDALGWHSRHTYCCLYLQLSDMDQKNLTANSVCAYLENILTGCSAFPHGGGIVAFFNLTLSDFSMTDLMERMVHFVEDIISINEDSHTVLDSKTYNVASTIVYDESNPRSTDAEAATTKFDFADDKLVTLSRAGHFANYAEAVAAPSDYTMSEESMNTLYNDHNWNPEDFNDPNDEMPVTGANNGLKLADLRGADYDDERWDTLLDQMTVTEMDDLIALGGYQTKAEASVDKYATIDCDGPAAINNNFTGVSSIGFPSEIIIASTFNTDLARRYGESIGRMASEMNVTGWYAPAMNGHRSAFDGRNFEYYSEDSVLAGYIGASSIAGAQSYGVYAYMKHFALNDQQINQNEMLCTWADEQAIREIYLRPFEISAKVGGCKAVMSSWNYIGNQWAGACNALLNGVLRGEWGFRGMVITDGFHFTDYMDSDIAIRNGCDLMLKNYDVATNHLTDTTSATSVKAMRQACKNIMYTVVNSRVYDPANTVSTPIWRTAMIVVDVLLAVLLVVLEVLTFKSYKKKKAQ